MKMGWTEVVIGFAKGLDDGTKGNKQPKTTALSVGYGEGSGTNRDRKPRVGNVRVKGKLWDI